MAKYAEAEKVLAGDFPTVPLSFALAVTFHSERVDNVVIDPFSGATKLRLLNYVGDESASGRVRDRLITGERQPLG